LSVIKVFFHPNAPNRSRGRATGRAIQGRRCKTLPVGTTPPNILRYNASSVPILRSRSFERHADRAEEYDLGYNFIRTQLANIQGASIPLPYGGRPKQVMIDINPQALILARALGQRRVGCAQQPEPDSADRFREDRHARIQRAG
jgi:multidrug efflux pump subunit AcrB